MARRIIDAHTHIFPEKIAHHAVDSIGEFYDLPLVHGGTSQDLLESGSGIGTERYLVCSTATTPTQVESINNFIAQECQDHPEFFGFASLHPAFENPEAEIDRILQLGLHGVKLHPDFQRFNIDDEAVIPLYRLCARAGLPILFHTGDDRYDYSTPARMSKVARMLPELTCIAAHFGGYLHWQEVELYKGLPNIYFDTSSSLFLLPAPRAEEIIDMLGDDRFFFGTDFPMWDHRDELERFMALNLSEETRDKLLYKNFARVF